MTGLHYIPLIIEKLKLTDPEKIILFGSYAYGEPSTESDLDILVVTGDDVIPSSFSEKSLIYLRISKVITELKKEFPIDLIVHTKAMHRRFIEKDSLFARELLTKGKVIYEKTTKEWFDSAESDLLLLWKSLKLQNWHAVINSLSED